MEKRYAVLSKLRGMRWGILKIGTYGECHRYLEHRVSNEVRQGHQLLSPIAGGYVMDHCIYVIKEKN